MKKYIIFLFASLVIGLSAHAQQGGAVKLPLAVGDTIANAGTVTKIITVTGGFSGASITVGCNVLSGTGAGTVTLLGSNDGINYTAIGSPYTITNTANNGITFNVAAPLPYKLKISAVGSGTESTVISVWYRLPGYQSR